MGKAKAEKVEILQGGPVHDLIELLTEHTLFNLGLSSIDPKGEESTLSEVFVTSICSSLLYVSYMLTTRP